MAKKAAAAADKTPADKPTKLTPNDPVSPEALERLNELERGQYQIALRLLQLEEDKVKLLAASHQVNQQRQRMFEQVLMERGMPPQSQVEIDSDSGKITLFGDKPKKSKS